MMKKAIKIISFIAVLLLILSVIIGCGGKIDPTAVAKKFYSKEGEGPFDNIPEDGGFAAIFRTVAVIGDSMAAGEFETDGSNVDLYDYSWPAYLGRITGATVYNFSRGGMTAMEYMETYADKNDYWNTDYAAECYILALGCNDFDGLEMPVGDISDINFRDYTQNNTSTFCGYYAQIIQRYKEIQPDARFFLCTMLHDERYFNYSTEEGNMVDAHRELLYKLAEEFEFTYVIDFATYGPVWDDEFRENFCMGEHYNAAGYLMSAKLTCAYIDYIIRNNPEEFRKVSFIGTRYTNSDYLY